MPTFKVTDEAHWLSLRGQHIGGSDVSALFNRWMTPDGSTVVLHAYEEVPEGAIPLGSCSPYTTAYALWLEKAGKVMPNDFAANERVAAGTFLEPALADWAKSKWGWKLRKVKRYDTHPTIEGWGASVDYEVHGIGMEPVEFKNVDGLVFMRDWQTDPDDRDVVSVPPLHIILQLQHYIGARGAAAGWITCCIGGNRLVRGRFERHEPTIARIGQAIEAFWRGVRAGIAPNDTPFDAVKEEFAYGEAVDEAQAVDLSDDAEAAMLARRLMRWKKHLDFTDTYLDRTKGKLAVKVGTKTKARGDGFKISWPVIERAEKMIPARLQTAATYRGGFTVTELKEKKPK